MGQKLRCAQIMEQLKLYRNMEEVFKKALETEWYVQGFNAVPIFISGAALCGFPMNDKLGFAYKQFLFVHQDGYIEMCYRKDDLARLWKVIEGKMQENPEYLYEVREMYEEHCAEVFAKFNAAAKNMSEKTEEQMLELFKQGVNLMMESVGVSHVIEPVSMHIEDVFLELLRAEVKDPQKVKDYFRVLSTPSQSSFVNDEEHALAHIHQLTGRARERAIEKHIQDWVWVRNTYAGARPLTAEVMEDRLRQYTPLERTLQDMLAEKKALIEEEDFSTELLAVADIIDFTTVWQDERKAYILQAIHALDRVLQELARRTGLSVEELYCADVYEVYDARSLADVGALQSTLQERQTAMVFIAQEKHNDILEGKEAITFSQAFARAQEGETKEELRGAIANTGTAIGTVRICKSLAEIDVVEDGDILVTSMTRPEFMPALRKAAAIVTDEGGITSHAAIVSRELGIPAVIGTKVATQILKDGMTVEVRANHGLVRVIEKL